MTASPPLSVVMPVRNALPFLDEAVESILAQSFGDFEFVILDDGSDDGSSARLRGWAQRDRRIRLVEPSGPPGPARSSHAVVTHARAPIVARMDADDISLPDRLARQLALLRLHADVGMVATLHESIGPDGGRLRQADWARLRRRSRFAPFVHGSIMFRRSAFERAGGYQSGHDYWEDIGLFLRIAQIARVAVIPEPLYRHRITLASTRLTGPQERVARAYGAMYRALEERPLGKGGVPPATFPLMGSPVVWLGRSPRLLRLLAREAALRIDRESLRALVWTAWAEAHPRSLRLFLRTLLALRNSLVARDLAGHDWVEWKPPPPPHER